MLSTPHLGEDGSGSHLPEDQEPQNMSTYRINDLSGDLLARGHQSAKGTRFERRIRRSRVTKGNR